VTELIAVRRHCSVALPHARNRILEQDVEGDASPLQQE
jgi:hypothetical protein